MINLKKKKTLYAKQLLMQKKKKPQLQYNGPF